MDKADKAPPDVHDVSSPCVFFTGSVKVVLWVLGIVLIACPRRAVEKFLCFWIPTTSIYLVSIEFESHAVNFETELCPLIYGPSTKRACRKSAHTICVVIVTNYGVVKLLRPCCTRKSRECLRSRNHAGWKKNPAR